MNALRKLCSVFVAPAEPGASMPRTVSDASEAPAEPLTTAWSPPRAAGWTGPGAPPELLPDRQPAPVCVAVLSRSADALPTGASVALTLAAELACSHALVCLWSGVTAVPVGVAAPPRRGAARLARALAAGGLPGRATGRLVVSQLPVEDGDAERVARALLTAAGTAPVVLALGAARGPRMQNLLGEQQAVLVAVRPGSEDCVGRLAAAGLGGAASCPVPSGPGRTLAAAGVALSPAMRRRVAEVVS